MPMGFRNSSIVNSTAVPTGLVTLQRLQSIARRNSQVLDSCGHVERFEFSLRYSAIYREGFDARRACPVHVLSLYK